MKIETETQSQITRKISKVTLEKSGGVTVVFEETRFVFVDGKAVEKTATVPYHGHNLPHPDLLHAFSLLRSHLAILCSQLDGREDDLDAIESDEQFLERFKVTGITISGSGESEGVTLVGNRKIKRGTLNLVSNFTKFNDEHYPYQYADELSHLVFHAADEGDQYVDDKIAPDAQGKLPLDGDQNSDLES